MVIGPSHQRPVATTASLHQAVVPEQPRHCAGRVVLSALQNHTSTAFKLDWTRQTNGMPQRAPLNAGGGGGGACTPHTRGKALGGKCAVATLHRCPQPERAWLHGLFQSPGMWGMVSRCRKEMNPIHRSGPVTPPTKASGTRMRQNPWKETLTSTPTHTRTHAHTFAGFQSHNRPPPPPRDVSKPKVCEARAHWGSAHRCATHKHCPIRPDSSPPKRGCSQIPPAFSAILCVDGAPWAAAAVSLSRCRRPEYVAMA